MFNYDEFMHCVNAGFLTHSENLRYGQYLMNELAKRHPEINVPDDCDCFYDNGKASHFLRYIAEYKPVEQVE